MTRVKQMSFEQFKETRRFLTFNEWISSGRYTADQAESMLTDDACWGVLTYGEDGTYEIMHFYTMYNVTLDRSDYESIDLDQLERILYDWLRINE